MNATPHDGNESTIKRVKGVLPLSFTIAFLTFASVELSLNSSFHWVTSGDLGSGLAVSSNFQLVTPAGFIAWAVFFAAGADSAAITRTVAGTTVAFVGCGRGPGNGGVWPVVGVFGARWINSGWSGQGVHTQIRFVRRCLISGRDKAISSLPSP